jgi:hypothetical protein
MATWQTLRCASALGLLLLMLSSCADNGYLESSTTIQSICSEQARLAVLVTVFDPDDLMIDSVTATRSKEAQCYLESAGRVQDAGALEGAVYSCWEQGRGTYEVHVTSGDRVWTKRIDVPGDNCHVTERQELTFELK